MWQHTLWAWSFGLLLACGPPPATPEAPGPAPVTEPAPADPPPTSDYDPCGGKACGDSCNLCQPDDEQCVETAVLKVCSASGECSSDNPTCG